MAKITLVGAGVIGCGWAVIFARAGHDVILFDPDEKTLSGSVSAVHALIAWMKTVSEPLSSKLGTVSAIASLQTALADTDWVQESGPENVETKRRIFEDFDRFAPPHAILASSASAIPPSDFLKGLAASQRCIVCHPFNPPYLLPLVELVPSPETSEATLNGAFAMMRDVGQKPIVVRKEVFGFAANRLQYAVVDEAMHLVADGVLSPQDADLCLTEALGLRWSFLGPLETMDLNAPNGFAEYAAKFRDSYERGGRELGVARPWTDAAIAEVSTWRRKEVPAPKLAERRQFRDETLALLRGLFNRRHEDVA